MSAAVQAETVRWVRVARTEDFPPDAGACVKVGSEQVAVFRFAATGAWYACQNMCPHRRDMVLARGLVGDRDGEPKVACPQHKKTFSLCSGENLDGEEYRVRVYPVKEEGGAVYIGVDG